MSCTVLSMARGCGLYAKRASFDLSLYLVADRGSAASDKDFFHKVNNAIIGGVSCIQYRDLKNDNDTVVSTARRLQEMLKGTGIRLFVNGSIESAAYADGVFLEQKSLSYQDIRRRLGDSLIIGVPVRNREDAVSCNDLDVDYVSVKVFPSQNTNPTDRATWGIEGLRAMRSLVRHPIVAIGGIDLTNVESVARELESQDGVAMVGELWRGDTISTAKKIREILNQARSSKGGSHVI